MEKINILNTINYIEVEKIDDKKRPVVVVVPGGGYDHTSVREGIFISQAFNKAGFHTVTLRYRETLDLYPAPLEELLFAIDYARRMDCADKNKIILIGFSAGAHLVGLANEHYKEYKYDSKPNLNILCYPVTLSNDYFTHRSTFNYLLGDDVKNIDKLNMVDIVRNVGDDFAPSFVWHTATDESVPVFNSIKLVEALILKGIKCEYHIFPDGPHGLSLASKESAMDDKRKEMPYVARWFQMALDFIHNTLD